MMLYQGAESFKLWTGKEMPVEHIKRYFKFRVLKVSRKAILFKRLNKFKFLMTKCF